MPEDEEAVARCGLSVVVSSFPGVTAAAPAAGAGPVAGHTLCAPASGHEASVIFLEFYTHPLRAVGFILRPSGYANRRS